MVLVGKVNKEIVSLINHKGVPAVGLCGDDGRLMQARKAVRRTADGTILDLGRWERSTTVNTDAAQPARGRLRACRGLGGGG